MGEYLPGAMHERLRELRESHGYSNQGMLADAIGIHRSTYSRIENGDTKTMSSEILIKLAKLYNVPTDYILGISDTPENTCYDIKELGLSVEAAKNLYTKKVDPRVINELLINDKFAFATKLMAQYFSGTIAMMQQAQNMVIDFNYKMLEEMNRTGKIPNDSLIKDTKRKIKASKLPDTQMELDRIQHVLTAALREIKEKCMLEIQPLLKQYEILNYEIIERVHKEVLSEPNLINMPEEEKEEFTRNAIIQSISITYNLDDNEVAKIAPVIDQLTPSIINSWKTEN